MSKKSEEADKIIDKYVMWSMGAGAIPIPIADTAALIGVQLKMLKDLCENYDVDYDENFGRRLITSLTGGILASVGASLLKTIPGVGSFLGSVPMVILSGTSTYAMGHVFKQHLAAEGILTTLSFDYAKKMYNEYYESGKDYVMDLRKQMGFGGEEEETKTEEKASSSTNSKNQEIYEKLQMLQDLREKGILDEAEFKEKKEKLLNEL